jgi:hypothetical protein
MKPIYIRSKRRQSTKIDFKGGLKRFNDRGIFGPGGFYIHPPVG